MKYFLIKPEVEETDSQGNKSKLGYEALFETMMGAPYQNTTAEFLRLAKLYQKFSDVQEGEILEIEDQDFDLIKKKLNAYVEFISKQAPMVVKSKMFTSFVEDVENMKSEKPA